MDELDTKRCAVCCTRETGSQILKYERKLNRAFKEGDVEEILNTLNLVATGCKKEGQEEEADEHRVMYLLFAGMSFLGVQRSLKEQKNAITYFREAKQILHKYPTDPETKDLIILIESLISIAKAYCSLSKYDVEDSVKLLEESAKKLLALRETLPDFAGMAEQLRLQVLGHLYCGKAMKAFEHGDIASGEVFTEEAARIYRILSEKSDSPELKRFFTAQTHQAQALYRFMKALQTIREELRCPACGFELSIGLLTNATESDQVETLKNSLKESQDLLRKSLAELRAIDPRVFPKVESHLALTKGLESAGVGIQRYAEAYQALLSGHPSSARMEFKNALGKLENASHAFAKAGEIVGNSPFMSSINSLKDSSRKWIRSIERENRKLRRRIALSASKQFGAFFVLFLLFFIALDYYNMLSITPDSKIKVALGVSVIAAFGANAVKLKDLLKNII